MFGSMTKTWKYILVRSLLVDVMQPYNTKSLDVVRARYQIPSCKPLGKTNRIRSESQIRVLIIRT